MPNHIHLLIAIGTGGNASDVQTDGNLSNNTNIGRVGIVWIDRERFE